MIKNDFYSLSVKSFSMDGGPAVVAVRRQHRVDLSLAFARSHSPIHRSFSRCLFRRQSKIPVTSEDREKKQSVLHLTSEAEQGASDYLRHRRAKLKSHLSQYKFPLPRSIQMY